METWAPANEVESRLLTASQAGDVEAVMRLLMMAPLVLPGYTEQRPDGRQRVVVRDLGGVPYLLVFTSPEAMRRAVPAAEDWRATNMVTLIRSWSGLTGGAPWGLAVNAATPVGVRIAPDAVPTLVQPPPGLASFVPANEVERQLHYALTAPDGALLLTALLSARVTVPVHGLVMDDVPTVAVFTAPHRCEQYLRGAGLTTPTTELDFAAVLHRWPGPDHQLAVNPGSPIGFALPGGLVPGLLAHANRPRSATVAPPPQAGGIVDLLRGV
jgi:hypothetical protein